MSEASNMTARDYLSIPYRIEAFSYEAAAGELLRHASYPELPDCSVEAPTITDALQQLERRRIEVILSMLRQGTLPPVPRPPLSDCDPEGLIIELGLEAHLPQLRGA
jgi:hypothetical protein